MLLNKTILSFLYFLIHYIAYTPFISLLHNLNKEYKKSVCFAVFCAAISTIFYLLLPQNSYSMILSIFNILLVFLFSKFIFNLDKNLTLEFTFVCSFLLFITNFLCLSFNILPFSKHYFFYESIMFFIVVSIFYKILNSCNIKNVISIFKFLKSEYDICILSIILIFSLNFTYIINLEIAYNFLFTQLMLAFFILQIIKYIIKINFLKLSYSNINFECNKLRSIVDDIRMFKHDYNNTLCSIGGYISLNDMSGLKNFYNKLTFDINKTNITQMINPKLINEPSIYNLLISKHHDIIENKLNFNFYSTINYKNITISPYDFSKILGIFLDNAIDAASKTKEKEIYLCCEINKNKDYEITIKNSYINKDVDIEKIFLKGYSSKKVKSGLGLWEVSKIIKTIPNISLHTEKDEKYFVQKLLILD